MTPADAVTRYLTEGGDPEGLGATLYDRGWVNPTSAVVVTDVDGDGSLDLAAGLSAAPAAGGVALTGGVTLWRCTSAGYVREEIAPPRDGFSAPALRLARDLTGDLLPELVVAYPECGAHTCFAQFAVYQWDGRSMVDRFWGSSDDMPTPDLAVQTDRADRPSVIVITAEGIGSVGAGPYRVWSRSWTWDDGAHAFVPGEAVVEPPRFRIHVIHDADDAFLAGDENRALALYQRAIEDDSLLGWPSEGDGRAALAAYAAYRRVLTYLVEGDRPSAQAEVDQRLTGLGGAGEGYARAARFLIEVSAESSLPAACAEVRQLAQSDAESLLAPLDYGYANRTYSADDICPVR